MRVDNRRPRKTHYVDGGGRANSEEPAWSGRIAFGPWWLLYGGPVGPTDLHAHHAFQLVVHAGSPFVVDAAGHTVDGLVVVVEPDSPHAYRGRRDHVLVAYIDPECDVGRQLRTRRTPAERQGEAHPVSGIIGGLRPDNWSRAEEAVQRMVATVCQPLVAKPMSWWRHPAIDAALARLPALADDGSIDIAELAEDVGLSVIRLTQVFSDEIGMPIRAYVRWMRLVNASERLATGASVTDAARDAGFADGAHFSRTFRSMFGLSPSEAVGSGRWLSS